MILSIISILLGIVLVVDGADRLTNGCVALAERFKISQMVIGLTIVAMGTSMPEFCVSMVSAIKGSSDLAVGNIVGSNIFNAMLIVGIAAMVAPMVITRPTVRKDVPFAIFASVLLTVLCIDGNISRLDSIIMLVVFGVFMYITLRTAKQDEAPVGKPKNYSKLKTFMLIILGLALLIIGSNVFVYGATEIAKSLGVSEAVIGLTIVAGGTSLPELATSVVAAKKGNSAIAIGNVLGSNVFNILMILGITGVICPMDIKGIGMSDFLVLTGSMVLLWLFSYTKYTIARWEGAVLTALYIAYLAYLIYFTV
jgi:cation:H+ antiporter